MKNVQNVNSDNVPKVNLLKDVVPIRQCAKGISYANNKPAESNQTDYLTMKINFVKKIKEQLVACDKAFGKNKKLLFAHVTYYHILNSLPHMFNHEPNVWIKFMVTAYNKVVEFENIRNAGDLIVCSKRKVEEAFVVFDNYKKFCIPYIMNKKFDDVFKNSTSTAITFECLIKARENIENEKNQRPKRNIKRVNYAGMDMTSDDEGEICVFKPWFEDGKLVEKCFKRPLSQANEIDDEDYIFEEDEDDEYEEEEAKEQFCKKIWAKIHPETAPMTRTTRTRKQVNYTGMDMTSEDIGEICVFKPWFQDGKVIEKCFRRPLSKANELDDEEYIFEEVEEY
jgi:hypothetical protein